MDSIPIRHISHTKYLGVTIASNLSWNKYIQNKPRQVNNFLYHNLHQCPSHTKCSCYKIMVHPIIEYAGSVWDPHTFSNINKLESIQRRAARVSCNDFLWFSSVMDMLSSLNLPLLQTRRTETKLITLYKIINGHLIVPTCDLIRKCQIVRSGYYHQPTTLTDSYKFSFFPSTIKIWNQLPVNVINSPTTNDFCSNLSNFWHTHPQWVLYPQSFWLHLCIIISLISAQ